MNEQNKDKSKGWAEKLRVFWPILLAIFLSIALVTMVAVFQAGTKLQQSVEENLQIEVNTILKMFEREHRLKTDKVQHDLQIVLALFQSAEFKISKDSFLLNVPSTEGESLDEKWLLNDRPLDTDTLWTQKIYELTGRNVSFFRKTDSIYVNISNNKTIAEDSLGIGRYFMVDSELGKAIESGENFYAISQGNNHRQTTAYAPLYSQAKLVGALCVSDTPNDLQNLREVLVTLKLGKSGYSFVFDPQGTLLIHPLREGEKLASPILAFAQKNKRGVMLYQRDEPRTVAIDYFEPFDVFVGASVNPDTENKAFIMDLILYATLAAILVIVVLSFFVYRATTENTKRFTRRIKHSDIALQATLNELQKAEKKYKTLFDSIQDAIFVTNSAKHIVEVNQYACDSLGYSREDFKTLQVNDIRSPRFNNLIDNLRKIPAPEHDFYESENITSDGRIIPVEIKSTRIKIGTDEWILSIARDTTERKETEKRILAAVIEAEERERKRFAKELHDGVGPLLSTIKLYVNELADPETLPEEQAGLIKYSNELIDDAVTTIRSISNNLTPSIVKKYGLSKAILSFCSKVNAAGKLTITFDDYIQEQRFEENVEMVFYRIVTELINNTIKHAQANNVGVLIRYEDSRLVLEYEDDGIGFEPDEILRKEKGGMGLRNIMSRVKSINGRYDFEQKKQSGAFVKIDAMVNNHVVTENQK